MLFPAQHRHALSGYTSLPSDSYWNPNLPECFGPLLRERVAAQPVELKKIESRNPALKTFYEIRGGPEPKLINITQEHYVTIS
jgi:hypothetical protein